MTIADIGQEDLKARKELKESITAARLKYREGRRQRNLQKVYDTTDVYAILGLAAVVCVFLIFMASSVAYSVGYRDCKHDMPLTDHCVALGGQMSPAGICYGPFTAGPETK